MRGRFRVPSPPSLPIYRHEQPSRTQPQLTELSSQAGQAKPVTNEPTAQEMETWDKDKLLQWIRQKKPGLLEDEDECNLSIVTSSDLADLANETKKSKQSLSYLDATRTAS